MKTAFPHPIKLVRYTPCAGGRCRIFGAVWQRKDAVHWASPIVRRTSSGFDPQPFMNRFPDAAFEVGHFEAAIDWLDSVCFAAKEPLDVAIACASEGDLGLSCVRYAGPKDDGDLASLLGADEPSAAWDEDLLRSSVGVSLSHLVKDHPALQGIPLETVSDGSLVCARLHLSPERVVRIVLDAQTGPADVPSVLQAEHHRLVAADLGNEHSFFVFARLTNALPLSPTARVTGTGIKFSEIANGLVRLVSGLPGSSRNI